MKNPYTLQFGKEPDEYISRMEQKNRVIESFLENEMQIYMITGVRGLGKTAFMSNIKSEFIQYKDWVVVEIGVEDDMLSSLAAKLNSESSLGAMFKSAKINLSLLGLGVEIGGVPPIANIEVALGKMLETLKKHKKKLLILVDEVINNSNVRMLASAFQIYVRDQLPIYLLMTGLYDNIDDLQNEKNMTFLHRAPKIHLNPLNIGTMALSYRKNIKVDEENALKMAQLTKGYPYAFQVLGYLTWKNNGDYEASMPDYKQYLEEYVYDKIWSELSRKDKQILYGIASVDSGKVADIRAFLNITTNEFNPYSKRLKRKEIITGDERGYVSLTLPLFDRFVIENTF